MTVCKHSVHVQSYLDDLLPEDDARAFREHLEDCATCAAELTGYGQLFARLDRLTLVEPSSELVGRVLDRVLPSRVRWRWVRTLGWGYAATLAASLAGITTLLSFQTPRTGLISLANDASLAFVQSVQTVLNLIGFAMLKLASGWSLLNAIGERLAPIGRALTTLLAQPGMDVALVTSALFCAALIWWIRQAGKRSTKGMRHVGLLGF